MMTLSHITGFVCGKNRQPAGAASSTVAAGLLALPSAAVAGIWAHAGSTRMLEAVRASCTGLTPGVAGDSTSQPNHPRLSGGRNRVALCVIRQRVPSPSTGRRATRYSGTWRVALVPVTMMSGRRSVMVDPAFLGRRAGSGWGQVRQLRQQFVEAEVE